MSIWADRKHATAKSAKTLPALEGTLVSIYPINTGYLCVSRASLVEGGSPNEILQIPCFAFLLHHPVEGFVLFDIGIPSRFLPDEDLAERKMKPDSPRFFPTVTKGMNVNSQLAQAGIESLDKVILSHSISKDDLIDLMHLPTNSISVGVGMKLKLISRKDYGTDLDRKLIETNFDTGRTLGAGRLSALGPFERTIDMYGDGSIYLVDLPGPCEGHMGILTRTEGSWVLLPGLAIYLRENYQRLLGKGKPIWKEKPTEDKKATWNTITVIAEYASMPDTKVYASYEPALLEELGDQFLLQDFAKRTSGYWQYVAPDTK